MDAKPSKKCSSTLCAAVATSTKPGCEQDAAMSFGRDYGSSWRRIAAMIERYWYLLRSSWPRLLELVYWPAVQMLMWGFLQLYIGQNAGYFGRAGGTFICAVRLWDILF